ncbi:MAG TPA: hypothetical protein VFE58_00380 [Tepidisphaeraceae bacterium]|jgi:hypothetical protein|nr:hypothetical protein [Tepidisphaeraceae bacterium]
MENSSDKPEPVQMVENRLFGEIAIGVASLIGTPVAGGVLLGINALRMRQRGAALIALVMGGLLTFTLLGLVQYVSQWVTAWALLPAGGVLMVGIARTLQGNWVTRDRMRGMVMAVGTGVVVAAIGYFVVQPLIIKKPTGIVVNRIMIADKQSVNYAMPIGEADARRVGEVLKRAGYFDGSGNPKTVFMVGDADGQPMVIFPADPEKAKNPEVVKLLALLARGFIQSGLPMPFTIRLAGPDGKVLNEVKVKYTPATTQNAVSESTTRSDLRGPLGTP